MGTFVRVVNLINKMNLIFFLALIFIVVFEVPSYSQEAVPIGSANSQTVKSLSLNDCIKIALDNNHQIKASKEGITVAEAQKKQAESGYWPQISASAAYSLMDQDPLFILPSFQMSVPPISVFGSTLKLDNFTVPEEDIKLMNKQNVHASVDLTYPLYTGGKIQAVNEEAKYGIEIAKQEYRKSNLEIEYDVKHYYYAVLLAERVYKIGTEALDRLNVTLELTESLYKNGSGSTTKLDYLKNKVIVDQVKALVGGLREKVKSAKEALSFELGIKDNFSLSSDEIPFDTLGFNQTDLTQEIYNTNPDWMKLNAAVSVFNAKIDEAKSGYLPSIAVIGSFNQNFNSYKYGVSNSVNNTMWMIGLGAQIQIFNGFRTKNEINEAEAQLRKISEQKNLLHDALNLQINNALNNIEAAVKNVKNTLEAKNTASENSSLTERAFQQDMATAKDLIEAQIMESLSEVQYQKALYDHALAEADLELLLGARPDGN